MTTRVYHYEVHYFAKNIVKEFQILQHVKEIRHNLTSNIWQSIVRQLQR